MHSKEKTNKMTKSQLNELTVNELIELNKKVVEVIKLKRLVQNNLQSDILQKGMIVIYKGTSPKIQSNEKFEISKVNKTKATCTSLLNSKVWDIYLGNLEPCKQSVNNEIFINQ